MLGDTEKGKDLGPEGQAMGFGHWNLDFVIYLLFGACYL
jgi:hypothetical protein